MRFRKIADSIGAVAVGDIPEGRMCIIVAHDQSVNYGSREDLVGARLPATADEALEALYLAAFTVTNQEPPIYDSLPEGGILRGGFSVATNLPFSADVYTTAPSMLQGQTISSGSLVALHAGGTYTVTSGNYVFNVNVGPGARMEVLNTADDGAAFAGMLSFEGTAGAGMATVIQHDTDKRELTFRTRQP